MRGREKAIVAVTPSLAIYDLRFNLGVERDLTVTQDIVTVHGLNETLGDLEQVSQAAQAEAESEGRTGAKFMDTTL